MRISVCMPSFNQARFIEAAIVSVLSQDHDNVELIFVDGGSTDGTLDIASRYKNEMAVCVSEPDRGQSDALRKGFEKATGDVLTWLNTDDLLLPGALRETAAAFERGAEWMLGNVVWISVDGLVMRVRKGERYSRLLGPRMGVLSACGPSAFFSRDLYRNVGGINVDFNYSMDTDLWWRFAMSGARFVRLSGYTWALRLHEEAKTSAHLFRPDGDAAAQRAVSANRAEDERINVMTRGYRFPVPRSLAGAVKIGRKATSPAYLRGIADDLRWRGKSIDLFARAHPGPD